MQSVILRDLSVGLLYVLDDIDNLAEHLVESTDGIVWGRWRGQSGGPPRCENEVLVTRESTQAGPSLTAALTLFVDPDRISWRQTSCTE